MEQNKVSIKKNFVMNAILSMSSFLFPLLTFPYVSRILSPSGMGKVALATSVITYFNMFAQLGVPTYGIRVCAMSRDNKNELSRSVQEILAINLVTCFFSYVIFVIVLFTVPKLKEEKALYIIMGITMLLSTLGVDWVYKGLEKYSYITKRSILFKVIAVVAMLMMIDSSDDYVIYGLLSIFASCASNILNFINLHKYVSLKKVEKLQWRKHIKGIGIFFLMSCATVIYINLDTVMLGFMKTEVDVGYYSAAVKVKTILVSLVTSLGAVLLPRASYYIQERKYDEFWRISNKALNFVVVVSIPMVVYFILYAKETILFLAGIEYGRAVLPMQVIMPTVFFIGITNILGMQILVPLGKEKIVLYSEIVGAVVDIILNAILIPRYAATGAAIGTLVAELCVLIVQSITLRDSMKKLAQNIRFMKVVVATLSSSVISILVINSFEITNFLRLCISAAMFFGVYGVLLLIFKETIILDIYTQTVSKFIKKK